MEFPFLLRVPCSAHSIQLIVKDVLLAERWAEVKSTVEEVLKQFSSKKECRTKLHSLQEASGRDTILNLIKPNETRWNSFLYASRRLQALRAFVDLIFKQNEDFWGKLTLLIDFLEPFQTATDIVQRDSSTLFDVFEQWNVLNKHLLSEKDGDVRNLGLNSLRDRWHANVNTAATNATALLSFIQLPEDTDEHREAVQLAKEEIASFGSQYLSFFEISKLSVEELHGRLLLQFGAFRTRTPPFAMLERDRRLSSSPIQFWSLNIETELAKVAIALLSIPSSEAAVERTFSAQDSIHRKKRNALKADTVQASMFIAFNHRKLTMPDEPLPEFKEVELSLDYADPETDSENESESSSSSEDELDEDDDVSMAEEEESEDAATAAVSVPMRLASEVFLQNFIRDNNIHRKTRFGPDLRAKLDEAAREHNPGGAALETLIKKLRRQAPPL